MRSIEYNHISIVLARQHGSFRLCGERERRIFGLSRLRIRRGSADTRVHPLPVCSGSNAPLQSSPRPLGSLMQQRQRVRAPAWRRHQVAGAAWRRRFLRRRGSVLAGPALRERSVCGGRAPQQCAERTNAVRFPIGTAPASRVISALQRRGEAPKAKPVWGDPGAS